MGRLRTMLLGAWLTALFWPFAHGGGYLHPALLGLMPLALSAGDLWDRGALKVMTWAAVVWAELSLSWNTWTSWHGIHVVVIGAVHLMLSMPVADWGQISARAAAPLLLLGGMAGWILFRQCRRYGQALVLELLGAVVIPLNHTLWHLPDARPLAAYLAIGLSLLALMHSQRWREGAAAPMARPWWQYLIGTVLLMVPLAGWALPTPRVTVSVGAFHTFLVSEFSSFSNASTGYGPGVTNIGHSLVPNRAPVFVAKTRSAHYWQAAVYTQFNGTRWSNPGSDNNFQALPGNWGIPYIAEPFNSQVLGRNIQIRVVDVSRVPFRTLFYPGAPTGFSVPVTVYMHSERFIAHATHHYAVSVVVPYYDPIQLDDAPFGAVPKSLRPDLEMPGSLSPKVAALAQKITRHTPGPWAAAEAIKRYLDAHYRYSYHVTPAHGNVVNHFLFVDHQGYCDQFSTAFIMMMRSLGVPARWIVGYAPGTWDPAQHGYLVRAIDAHAWAEIWLQGQGWVAFDPTPGFSIPIRFSTPSSPVRPSPVNLSTARVKTSTIRTSSTTVSIHPHAKTHHKTRHTAARRQIIHHRHHHRTRWSFDVAGLLTLIGLFLVMQRPPRPAPAARVWSHIQAVTRRRFGTTPYAQSPRQWGQAWVRREPGDAAAVWSLVRLLESAFYGESPLTQAEVQQMQQIWRSLRKTRHSA